MEHICNPNVEGRDRWIPGASQLGSLAKEFKVQWETLYKVKYRVMEGDTQH